MDREETIAELCLRDGGIYLTGMVPTRFVTVGGPADKYADAELALLADFTRERQAAYHVRCGGSKLDWADNFISIDKEIEGGRTRWGRKRLSWREGRMHSASLPEALATFWSDRYHDEMVGDFVLTSRGEILEVAARIPYDREDRDADFACRRLADGAEIGLKQYEVGGILAHARSLEALGDMLRMAMEHRIEGRRSRGDGAEDRARRAVTASNDPAALQAMWAERVRDFHEENAERAAA